MSGYPVMDPTRLVIDGKLDKRKFVKVTISNPENWSDEGYAKGGKSRDELFDHDSIVCFEDLWKQFLRNARAKKGIKDYCDWEHCPIEHENPTPRDMLQLISILWGYCGKLD